MALGSGMISSSKESLNYVLRWVKNPIGLKSYFAKFILKKTIHKIRNYRVCTYLTS